MRSALSLSAASVVALVAATSAAAQSSTQDLEDKVQALEAALAAVKAELEAHKSSADASLERIETRQTQQEATIKATQEEMAAAGSFAVGDTKVTYGGLLDLDVHATQLDDGGDFASGSVARDFYIPGATPTGGDGEDSADFDMTAEASRFFFATSSDVDGNKIGTRIEFDFLLSGQGNERVSNSYAPRLRRAEFTWNKWLFGQSWSTFQILQSIPESASFLVASDGMVFIRQAQVRYTNGPWQFALENPNTTVTPAGGGRIVADDNAIPDAVVRYNRSGDWGTFSVAGIARQLSFDNNVTGTGGVDDSTYGFGVNVGGRMNFDGGDFRWQVAGGQGLGRYIGLNAANGAFVDANGDLEAITSYGGLAAVRFKTGPKSRVNVGASYLTVDNDDIFANTGALETVYSGFGNVMWDVAPKVTMGVEILFGQRENENGTDGSILRSTFSAKRAF